MDKSTLNYIYIFHCLQPSKEFHPPESAYLFWIKLSGSLLLWCKGGVEFLVGLKLWCNGSLFICGGRNEYCMTVTRDASSFLRSQCLVMETHVSDLPQEQYLLLLCVPGMDATSATPHTEIGLAFYRDELLASDTCTAPVYALHLSELSQNSTGHSPFLVGLFFTCRCLQVSPFYLHLFISFHSV